MKVEIEYDWSVFLGSKSINIEMDSKMKNGWRCAFRPSPSINFIFNFKLIYSLYLKVIEPIFFHF